MTHEGNPSLISLDLSYDLQRDESSLRRWMVSSLVFHLVVALVAINLRFSPTIEQPLSSYEVSLVSLPALEKPTPSRSKAKSVKRRSRKAQPKPRPKKKSLPPLPTKTSSERLSESLAGAAQSIVVPKTRTSQPQSKPIPEVKTSSDSSAALEKIKLPSQAPSLTAAERLAPRNPVKVPKQPPKRAAKPTPSSPKNRPTPKKSSPPKMNLQDALKGIKAPPKAPALAPLQPFTKASEVEPSPTKPEQLSQSLKEKIQSVQVPTRPKHQVRKTNKTRSQARRTKKEPPQPAPKRERLADSLKEVLESVNVPKLRDVSKTPPSRPKPAKPHSVKPNRVPAVSKKFRTEIDQQLAKLKIPDVAPIESIRTRLQLQEVKPGDSESASSSSSPSSSSKNSKGQNRYLGLIQAKIDQQWVAPPVAANEDNLQVVLKFRILRSGTVTNLDIDRGSGNPYYDSAAKRAVQAAVPLPPFPPEISESYLDVRYNFILGDSSS